MYKIWKMHDVSAKGWMGNNEDESQAGDGYPVVISKVYLNPHPKIMFLKITWNRSVHLSV